MGKESPVNAVLTLPLGVLNWTQLKLRKTESKANVFLGDGRGFVEEIDLCVLCLYSTDYSRVPALHLMAVWVLNGVSLCRIEMARWCLLHWWLLMNVSDARCHCEVARSCEDALDLQLGDSSGAKGNSWVRKSWFEGHFQGRAGPVSRGIGQLVVQPHRSSEMALSHDKEQGGLKGLKKLSSHQRASFWFSRVPSLRVEAQLAQVRQQPPPHQSDCGFRLLQWY